ncbi:hypothetical protein [Acinetobacter stercoris]|uniref:Uncharacterized protein n=1 Tax=Acinetobacter stercoris TaxID=2126983 RepID=A0A2U3MWD4_9GAMM|nr:hypothetical protein [Acinetobacter stercoris]SPL69731.1 hypothetical protein KPC_0909 [Acinetobacter stercoris]
MIDIYADDVIHWINVYAVIFSILILSLAINFTFFIKDYINRILTILVLVTVICWVINNYVFGYLSIAAEQQEDLASFIIAGFKGNIFYGLISLITSCFALIALIIRLIIQYSKSKSHPNK